MQINERSNKKYVSYEYADLFNGGVDDIAHWICWVVSNDSFDIKSVSLKDLQRSADEGNKSVQIKKPIDERHLIREIREREIDRISFDGYFKQVPLSISINILDHKLSIALNKNHVIDMKKLEQAMRLDRQRWRKH